MLPREKSGQFEGKIWRYHAARTAILPRPRPKSPAQQFLLPNLPSAQIEAAYVSEAVSAGVTAGIVPLERGNLAATLRLPRPDLRPASRGRL